MSDRNFYISWTLSSFYYLNYFYAIFIDNTRPLKHIFCFNYRSCLNKGFKLLPYAAKVKTQGKKRQKARNC